MNPLEDRYSRHRRLASFGAEGQRRLESTLFCVGTGAGATVQLSYLCRAGAQRLSIGQQYREPAFRHAEQFAFSVARDYANGAWRAIGQIEEALLIPVETDTTTE